MNIEKKMSKVFLINGVLSLKNKDRIFLGTCFGMPLGLVGMVTGSLFAFVFNKIVERCNK